MAVSSVLALCNTLCPWIAMTLSHGYNTQAQWEAFVEVPWLFMYAVGGTYVTGMLPLPHCRCRPRLQLLQCQVSRCYVYYHHPPTTHHPPPTTDHHQVHHFLAVRRAPSATPSCNERLPRQGTDRALSDRVRRRGRAQVRLEHPVLL